MGAPGVEDGLYGGFVTFDVNEHADGLERERADRRPETDRGVSAHDGIKISTITLADLALVIAGQWLADFDRTSDTKLVRPP